VKVKLICCGKTVDSFLVQGELNYQNRLKHYFSFERIDLPNLKNSKNLTVDQIKEEEAKRILKEIKPNQELILLDERGKTFSSVEFSKLLSTYFNYNQRDLVFLIGGPYGFSESVYERCNTKISLSKMTFSHQMVRMIFLEQLYRAATILKGEPYHHDE
jgi:23S rRNA (pseudouridine1915-N3)-methyltransferase